MRYPSFRSTISLWKEDAYDAPTPHPGGRALESGGPAVYPVAAESRQPARVTDSRVAVGRSDCPRRGVAPDTRRSPPGAQAARLETTARGPGPGVGAPAPVARRVCRSHGRRRARRGTPGDRRGRSAAPGRHAATDHLSGRRPCPRVSPADVSGGPLMLQLT